MAEIIGVEKESLAILIKVAIKFVKDKHKTFALQKDILKETEEELREKKARLTNLLESKNNDGLKSILRKEIEELKLSKSNTVEDIQQLKSSIDNVQEVINSLMIKD
ncbi:hypothetical protein KKB69_01445 [Patescibacteria group bacterium]|nr:hypothetical protein [Patescibacteria group bacterium]